MVGRGPVEKLNMGVFAASLFFQGAVLVGDEAGRLPSSPLI